MAFDNEFGAPATVAPNETVDFSKYTAPPDSVDFSAAPMQYSNVGMPLDVTDSRAQKAHFALQDKSPGLDILKTQFASGGEWDVRTKMALDQKTENDQSAISMLNRVAASEGPLTSEDMNFTLQTMKTRPVDPTTVLEYQFARKFAQFGTTVSPEINQVFSKGWQYLPGETAFEQSVATDLTARSHLTATKLEEVEQRWKNTPWFHGVGEGPNMGSLDKAKGAADAYALSLIPGLSWKRLHEALSSITTESILPGNNMAEKIQGLWLITDPDRFAKTLDAGIEELWAKNPLDAIVLARAAHSFSSSDQLLGNVFGWADIASVVPLGALAKGARWSTSLFKGKPTSELLNATETVSRTPGNFNPYAWEEGRVGPASDLLPQDVRDKARAITAQDPQGPVMNAKRGQTFDVNRGPSMQVERGPAWEVPSSDPQLQAAVQGVREMQLPLRGPTDASGLPHLEGDPTRDQFLGAWNRYYRTRPWMAPSDVNPDGSFPPALLPRRPNLPRGVEPDRYDQMMANIRQGMGDVVKAAGERRMDVETALVTLGDIDGAAKVGINRLTQQAAQAAAGQTVQEAVNLYDMAKNLPSSFNPTGLDRNPVGLSRERTNALYTTLQARGQSFLTGMAENSTVERLPPEALAQAYKEAQRDLKYQFHTLSDHILDFTNNVLDRTKNTRSVTAMLGNRGKVPFESADQARLFAEDIFKLPDDSYAIGQQGIGFTVNVSKPLNETESAVRDMIATTKYSQTPLNRLSGLLFGSWNPRSAEDLLSEFNRSARHTATHSPQNIRAFFKDAVQDITTLSGKDREQVQEILRANRDFENSAGERGRFYNAVSDFEVAFQDKFKRLPSEQQVKAYFSYTQMSDMDWVMRNLGALRDKERLGVQEHKFKLGGGDSPWVEGKLVRDFPSSSSQDSGIWFQKSSGEGTYIRRHDPEFDTKEINKYIEEYHYSLVQVAEPHTRPLMATTGEKDIINFVLTDTRETRNLPWKQVDYRPGGHVIYPYEWYVKQPQVAVGKGGRSFYYGDASIFNFSSEAEAKMWATRMEEGRKLLGNEVALTSYVEKNLPYSVNEFKNLFKEHLSADLPISHTQSGRNTIQTDKRVLELFGNNLHNEHDSIHNLYAGMDKTFLADRDMQLGTVSASGDVLKPWKIDAAPALDPYPALNNALGQAMRARYMNDYKVAAAEEWVQQFGHLLSGGSVSQRQELLRKNPLSTLYNGEISKLADKSGLREEARSAENARQRIIDFIGAKSEFESNLNRVQSILVDSIFNTAGKGAADYTATHLLPSLRDPAQYFRAVAFHTHLGFFNPVQLWVQSMSMFNSIAIAGPVNGYKGMAMGTIQHMLSLTDNPAMIDRAANIAKAVAGVNPKDFKESYEALRSTGLWHVAGETAWRDNVFDPKIIDTTLGTALDKGTMFFATGERQVRLTAWNTGYTEWRAANKLAELDNKAIGDILNRADTLSANMTRASNAAWQKGITSIPTQFAAYNARMMEQFLGKRLTVAEKSRAFLTYSALFGIPAGGIGPVAGFIDSYSDIKKAAMDRNLDMSDTYIKGMMEGIPSLVLSSITGKSYDIAKRMGPNGNSTIEDAWSGKKSIDEVLGGASYQTMKEIAKTTRPFFTWAYHAVQGNPDEFPLQIEDFAAEAGNIGTMGNLAKTIYGLNTGMYVTKNNVKVGPINNMDSIYLTLFGVKPMSIEDTLLKEDIGRERTKYKETETQRALTEMRRGMDAANQNDDHKSLKDHFKKATVILEGAGLNPMEKADVYKRFSQSSTKTMQDKVNSDWITKAPSWYQQQRLDNLKKTQGK